jgi:intergrase/recombinase
MKTLTDEQKNFLYLLAYMYLQQSKHTQALHLLRILRLHTAADMKIALALAYCLYKGSRLEEALKVLNSLDVNNLSPRHKTAYFFINSKVLWDLKKEAESRDMLQHYLKCRQLSL